MGLAVIDDEAKHGHGIRSAVDLVGVCIEWVEPTGAVS